MRTSYPKSSKLVTDSQKTSSFEREQEFPGESGKGRIARADGLQHGERCGRKAQTKRKHERHEIYRPRVSCGRSCQPLTTRVLRLSSRLPLPWVKRTVWATLTSGHPYNLQRTANALRLKEDEAS